jgi:hypothetical protein
VVVGLEANLKRMAVVVEVVVALMLNSTLKLLID